MAPRPRDACSAPGEPGPGACGDQGSCEGAKRAGWFPSDCAIAADGARATASSTAAVQNDLARRRRRASVHIMDAVFRPESRRIQADTRGFVIRRVLCYAHAPSLDFGNARRPRTAQNPPFASSRSSLSLPGSFGARDRNAPDHRLARARPRQAHAVALHRVRRRGARCRGRDDRGGLPRQLSRRQPRSRSTSRASGLRARRSSIAVVSRAAPAREDPGMGAGAVRRRRRHEPRAGRARARLCRELDHRMVRL